MTKIEPDRAAATTEQDSRRSSASRRPQGPEVVARLCLASISIAVIAGVASRASGGSTFVDRVGIVSTVASIVGLVAIIALDRDPQRPRLVMRVVAVGLLVASELLRRHYVEPGTGTPVRALGPLAGALGVLAVGILRSRPRRGRHTAPGAGPSGGRSRTLVGAVAAVALGTGLITGFSDTSTSTDRPSVAHEALRSVAPSQPPAADDPPSTSGMDMSGMDMSGMDMSPGDSTAPPLTDLDRDTLDLQLRSLRDSLPGATVGDALDAGYAVSNEVEGPNNVHLARPEWADEPFRPDHPAMLLATGRSPESRLLAAVFWIPTDSSDPPSGFAGSSDVWHRHEGYACSLPSGPTDATDPDTCGERGGEWIHYSGWMLHAWVLHDFPNRAGVFALNNDCLAADDCR